jgi:cation diffusion facilitator CzcD-associated flavoprotein CzcO
MTVLVARRATAGKHDVTQANPGNDCEVAVIGAGPCGLAVAAHLRSAKISTRAFGRPMSFWRGHMPRGMRPRSPWAATHIADPGKRFSLDVFARQTALAPGDQLPIERFVQCGDWFARHAVPDVDPRRVLRVENAEPGFRLLLEDEDVGADYAARNIARTAPARRRWANGGARGAHGGYRVGSARRVSNRDLGMGPAE